MENCLLLIGLITAVAGGFFLACALLGVGVFLTHYTAQYCWKKLMRIYHLHIIYGYLSKIEVDGTDFLKKKEAQPKETDASVC